MSLTTNGSTTTPGSGTSTPTTPSSTNLVKSNPLDKFQTFNCIFTLACLSKDQQNISNLKKEDIKNIVARTAGDWKNENKRVKLDFGTFDYFIDDVIIASIPTMSKSTANSFATKLTFKVTEPYSMGLFLLALQQGSKQGAYGINFKEASYVFMIEFVGNVNDMPSDINSIPAELTRLIPIKIISVKFNVTASGSVYEVEAIPYNEHAFRDPVAKIPTDTQITGDTVEELLVKGPNSLVKMLEQKNKNLAEQQGLKDFDKYDIKFPEDFMDEKAEKGNDIARSRLYEKLDSAGSVPFMFNSDVFDELNQIYRNSLLKLDTKRVWHFTQEANIPDAITEVIIRSKYIADQVTNKEYLVDNNGMLKWFRIETRVIDGADSKQLGRQQRTFIYRVVPYKVHVSKLLPPNAKPPGYDQLKTSIIREYFYTYTGKNTEILKLDINFDFAYFSAAAHDASERPGQVFTNLGSITASDDDLKQRLPESASVVFLNNGQQPFTLPPVSPVIDQLNNKIISDETQSLLEISQNKLPQLRLDGQPSEAEFELMAVTQPLGQKQFHYKGQGGAGSDNEQTSMARTYQAILTNDADMLTLNMEIMGDPYYIPSSGMGNLIGKAKSFNEMEDGAMNYQSGEVDIVIHFRTPIDINPLTGLYNFDKEISVWSGLYQIIEVESRFFQNRFTQVLKAFRRRTQVGGNTAVNSTILQNVGATRGETTPGSETPTPTTPGSGIPTPTTPPG